jgi:hypothetical protein
MKLFLVLLFCIVLLLPLSLVQISASALFFYIKAACKIKIFIILRFFVDLMMLFYLNESEC